jgi:hypothetical protein
MDEKKITGLTEEEQAWIDLDVTWAEKDPTVKNMIENARNGDRMARISLVARIKIRKKEVLATQAAISKKSSVEEKRKECEQKQRQLFLPGVSDAMAAQPNALARSSLFAPVLPGRRKFYQGEKLVSRRDVVIEYTGVQLNEDHADICMQLINHHISTGVEIGQWNYFEASKFLKQLGWGTSGGYYDKLRRYMKELKATTLIIETYKPDGTVKMKITGSGDLDNDPNASPVVLEDMDIEEQVKTSPTKKKKELPDAESFSFVEKFISGKGGKMYAYRLDPDWVTLFSNKEYALIDWDKRKKIPSNMQLAKSIQRLLCTSNENPQRFSLDFLKKLAQYGGRMRDFEDRIEAALDELRKVDEIHDWTIGTSSQNKKQVTIWTKNDTPDDLG